jgi:hypothetical protein
LGGLDIVTGVCCGYRGDENKGIAFDSECLTSGELARRGQRKYQAIRNGQYPRRAAGFLFVQGNNGKMENVECKQENFKSVNE